ncbi:PREDICTED: uncharacterized protein LOC108361176 [Rhagoletis zephyria]|uniref:uncharacterized protein LOC108361176 n=1 Tax=Rhagoletis zephyria TaxID=28612 RepID=UPI0008114309|nr:PREDICTED: uncharacterized protein LOC108361176 [Rhagoletis zephyria]
MTTCVAQARPTILLATARAYIYGDAAVQRLVRILCDPGSQVSFIKDRLAKSLRLKIHKCELNVEGIGSSISTRTTGSVIVTIKSLHSNFETKINALVIPSITSDTPAVRLDVNQWQHLAGLDMADIYFGTPGAIDCLIGADAWGRIVEGDIIGGRPDEPYAQRTRLGWVVFGPASEVSSKENSSLVLSAKLVEDDLVLEELVHNFWKLQEVPVCASDDDDECGRIFAATHSRTSDGRYMVQLPFRRDAPRLGESYAHALRLFQRLERRLVGDSELKDNYIKFMREYVSLGHMEPVNNVGDHTNGYYIPHHAVTTKFRVVFNASAPTSTGVSLNEVQIVGPTIQDSLINIILRFRRYRVALTADIEKMFRQVLVAPIHRDFQRILWRESPSDELKVYRLTTVTYGMACSPYNAIRALQQCARDNHNVISDHRQAAKARDTILTSFYVDDFLTSCENANDAKVLAHNVDEILSAGKFTLRKWNSNDAEVMEYLTGNISSSAGLEINPPTASVLGLRWDAAADQFFFQVVLKQAGPTPTKRRVLSEVAQLFDPTGFLAPVVVQGKVFIQRMWSAGLSWDAPLSDDLRDDWINYRSKLELLNKVRVNRWLGMAHGVQTTLHGFCDASSQAYAAVIYTRTVGAGERVQLALLTARTKVAPLKGSTIPRLELSAALLLAETLQAVRSALGLMNAPYYLWSDSSIALCWIKKQPTTLKLYVSNRVRQIQELTSPDRWHHIRSAQNPADCASRGISPLELLEHPLW